MIVMSEKRFTFEFCKVAFGRDYYQIVLADEDYRRVLHPNYVCEMLNNCAYHIGVQAENLYECVDCGDLEDE